MSEHLTVTGYEPRFDFDLRRGQVGEKKVGSILDALAHGTIEVKTDYGTHITGNLYIEVEKENRDGQWVPSGLAATEATHWAFAFGQGAIIVDTDHLKRVTAAVAADPAAIGFRQGNENSSSSRGVKVPVRVLVESLKNE